MFFFCEDAWAIELFQNRQIHERETSCLQRRKFVHNSVYKQWMLCHRTWLRFHAIHATAATSIRIMDKWSFRFDNLSGRQYWSYCQKLSKIAFRVVALIFFWGFVHSKVELKTDIFLIDIFSFKLNFHSILGSVAQRNLFEMIQRFCQFVVWKVKSIQIIYFCWVLPCSYRKKRIFFSTKRIRYGEMILS